MAVKFLLAAFVGILMLSCVSAAWPFKDCGSKGGKIVSLDFGPPATKDCTFPKGKNATAMVTVEMDEVTNKLTVVCKGDVVVWVPFPLPNPDACTQGVTCPTEASKQYTFKANIPIESEYPSLRLVVRMEFKDDKDQDAICMEFPASIC